MQLRTLQYLAKRLSYIDAAECIEAAVLVLAAESDFRRFENSSDLQHALFHSVWGHVSRALDHEEFSPEHNDALQAIEAEMMGHVFRIRLERRWLARTPNAPIF